MRVILLILVIALLVLWGQSALYSVDQAEFAYVTRFGEPVAIRNGENDAGLHLKWPWPIQSVDRLDRRLHVFDLPPVEAQTRDPLKKIVDKTLTIDAFVSWRIPDTQAADKFFRGPRTPEEARRKLTPLITGRLAALISSMPMNELIQVVDQGSLLAMVGGGSVLTLESLFRQLNEEVIDTRNERLRRRLLGLEKLESSERMSESIPQFALENYGIEIIDIRIRRLNYPEKVRGSIAERIRTERSQKAETHISEGNRKYTEIVSNAEREAAEIINKADERRKEIENQAKVDAMRIRGKAIEKDAAFFAFTERLKSYRAMLEKTSDVLLLSTKHPLFEGLLNPPKIDLEPKR